MSWVCPTCATSSAILTCKTCMDSKLEAVTRERDEALHTFRCVRETDEYQALQADAAAMRVALEQVRKEIWYRHSGAALADVNPASIEAALSTSAGKPLLEAVEAAGKALEEAKERFEFLRQGDRRDVLALDVDALDDIDSALALLAPFRVGGGK